MEWILQRIHLPPIKITKMSCFWSFVMNRLNIVIVEVLVILIVNCFRVQIVKKIWSRRNLNILSKGILSLRLYWISIYRAISVSLSRILDYLTNHLLTIPSNFYQNVLNQTSNVFFARKTHPGMKKFRNESLFGNLFILYSVINLIASPMEPMHSFIIHSTNSGI